MTQEDIITLGIQAVKMAGLLAGPILLSALFTGLIISLLQAATQINEMTLSFIPKIISVVVMLVLLGPWMLTLMVEYIQSILTDIPRYVG